MEQITAQQLELQLELFTGTVQYHKHSLAGKLNILLTDGVKYLAEQAGCYWLLDIILSYQIDPRVKTEPFQSWHLEHLQQGWKVTATDGNNRELITQVIEYSDFPLPEIKIWLVDEVAMLPSEY